MEINFENKRILVTGAGRGIGRAICKALIDCKATVIALSQTQANLDTLVGECPSIQTLCVNLKDWEATKIGVESVLPIHGLVNCAGLLHISSFLEFKPELIDEMYSVNFRGSWNVSQVIAKAMVEAGNSGTIVQLSSVASHITFAGFSGYGSIKSALDHMTRFMAVELGPHNIRVNCVNPTILTSGTDMGDFVLSLPGIEDIVTRKTPLRKLADMSDVIHAVLFFLSDKSGMTTGETLLVDGGLAIS